MYSLSEHPRIKKEAKDSPIGCIFPLCFPIGQSLGSSSLLLDPLISYIQGLNLPFLFAMRTICLMLPKLQYAISLTFIGALYVVLLPVTINYLINLKIFFHDCNK